jgi:AraC-like DNA-binding protein
VTQVAGYREWRPVEALAGHLSCTWAGRLAGDGTPFAESVLPDGCVDLIWDGVRLFVAGPDTGPVPIVRQPGGFFAGVRFRPGLAPTFLGIPAAELRDRRVGAADVLGPGRAAALEDGLHETTSLRQAARLLESALVEHLPGTSPPDRLVERVVAALRRSSEPSVASLAAGMGVSERQLHRRCTAAIGYGPKTLDRVLRFRRFLRLAASGSPGPAGGLAGLAAAAGYADQAHLTRECVRLAGTTPGRLVVRREVVAD